MSYMGSSSNVSSSSKAMDLSFKNILCKCRCKAAIKISESDRNPNKLYYTCMGLSGKQCNFFQWVHPCNSGEHANKHMETSYEEPPRDHIANLNQVELANRLSQLETTLVVMKSKFEDMRSTMKLMFLSLIVIVFALLFGNKNLNM
ncbi:hypothetical protein QJS10_CPA03g01446 [Acorus calamus]|uniref:GRF-type domain-containing protein n=1 Tax=Acorus calamus TaxID=4465 RepID=A0AAV9F9W7_ACOCL|nr:hypothetical protein QJS10_CPA03g01446 [Acorus calamus]